MNRIRDRLRAEGLVRPTDGRVLAGVCAGLAARFGIDPWLARLIFLALVLLPGSQLVLYPLLWVAMPQQDAVAPPTQHSW